MQAKAHQIVADVCSMGHLVQELPNDSPRLVNLDISRTDKHGLSFHDGLWLHAGRVAVPGASDLRHGIV